MKFKINDIIYAPSVNGDKMAVVINNTEEGLTLKFNDLTRPLVFFYWFGECEDMIKIGEIDEV